MESQQPVVIKKKLKLKVKKISNIYSKNVINVKTLLSMNEIGNNVESLLLSKIKNTYEGKCKKEGFIKHNSVKIINYSSGLVQGNNIIFEVVIQCYICKPVEGMIIKNCIVQNNTKAGIKASINEKNSPLVIFISRDHHYLSEEFSELKEGDIVKARVIGVRYELNDTNISVIAELVN